MACGSTNLGVIAAKLPWPAMLLPLDCDTGALSAIWPSFSLAAHQSASLFLIPNEGLELTLSRDHWLHTPAFMKEESGKPSISLCFRLMPQVGRTALALIGSSLR